MKDSRYMALPGAHKAERAHFAGSTGGGRSADNHDDAEGAVKMSYYYNMLKEDILETKNCHQGPQASRQI